jgi:hypothetical protein
MKPTSVATVVGVAVLLLRGTGAGAQSVPLADRHPAQLVAIGTVGGFVDMAPPTQLSYVAGAMQVALSTMMYCTAPVTAQFVRDSMVAEVRRGYFQRQENFTITLTSTLSRHGCHYEESVMGRLRTPQ